MEWLQILFDHKNSSSVNTIVSEIGNNGFDFGVDGH